MKSGLGKIFLKFLHALTMSFLLLNFDQKYKFSNKNNMVSAWRNFENIFPRPLFIIIFRPEILKFHPYSILTGDTIVGFVIFYVLRVYIINIQSTVPPLRSSLSLGTQISQQFDELVAKQNSNSSSLSRSHSRSTNNISRMSNYQPYSFNGKYL